MAFDITTVTDELVKLGTASTALGVAVAAKATEIQDRGVNSEYELGVELVTSVQYATNILEVATLKLNQIQ